MGRLLFVMALVCLCAAGSGASDDVGHTAHLVGAPIDLVSNRTSTFDSSVGPETYLFTTAAKNGWSTMVNLWRDYELSDRWSTYIGGGIGAGGYRFS